MPVYKDKKRGTYFFTFSVEDKNGVYRQIRRRGFKTKSEARQAEAEALLSIEDGEENDNDPTFEFVANEYLNWYKKRRKESSFNKTKSTIDNHLTPKFGRKQLSRIRPRDVTRLQDNLLDTFSPAHVKKIHSVLSATFNFAIKMEYATDNPARTAGNIDIEEEKHVNYWNLEEFKKFISVVDDELYHALFMTLYYSGMRKGELLALTWGDVDFENNTLNIDKTAYNRIITKPKTQSSIRKIIMPNHVMTSLSRLKANIEPKMSYVVFGEFHDHVSTTTLDRKYEGYIKESGVKKIRLHDFRHSHASYLINKNTIVSVIAQRLGHGNVATTLNTYSHLYPSTEREAVLKMEDDFKTAEVIEFKNA